MIYRKKMKKFFTVFLGITLSLGLTSSNAQARWLRFTCNIARSFSINTKQIYANLQKGIIPHPTLRDAAKKATDKSGICFPEVIPYHLKNSYEKKLLSDAYDGVRNFAQNIYPNFLGAPLDEQQDFIHTIILHSDLSILRKLAQLSERNWKEGEI